MRDFAVIQHHAHQLAGMSGIDLNCAQPRVRRLWLARALALHHLADGDMAEANKVMAPFKRRRMTHQQRAGALALEGGRHGRG